MHSDRPSRQERQAQQAEQAEQAGLLGWCERQSGRAAERARSPLAMRGPVGPTHPSRKLLIVASIRGARIVPT